MELTLEQIKIGNDLIVNFIGQALIHPNERKYHISWEWIIPVFEKINTMEDGNYAFSIGYQQAMVRHNHAVDFTLPEHPRRYFICESATTTIEAVWLTIVEFIKWYNITHILE